MYFEIFKLRLILILPNKFNKLIIDYIHHLKTLFSEIVVLQINIKANNFKLVQMSLVNGIKI